METVSPWKSHPQARKTQRLLAYILFTLQTENSISLDTLFVDSIGILQVLLSISIYKLFELYLIDLPATGIFYVSIVSSFFF